MAWAVGKRRSKYSYKVVYRTALAEKDRQIVSRHETLERAKEVRDKYNRKLAEACQPGEKPAGHYEVWP